MRAVARAALAALVAAVAWPGGATAAELVGHQAIYRASLGSVSADSGIAGVEGAVFYRFADACDGWTSENRTVLRLSYTDGTEARTDWTYTTWESKDGRRMSFGMRDLRDGELDNDLRGSASLAAPGKGGSARFADQPDAGMALPAGTLFPTAHLKALIDAALAGKRNLTRTVFDGASLDNPYTVGAVLSPAPKGVGRDVAAREHLADLPAWSMRLAYFANRDDSGIPQFEIGITYREDGIADSIVHDYGDFELKLRLQEVKLLPKPDC